MAASFSTVRLAWLPVATCLARIRVFVEIGSFWLPFRLQTKEKRVPSNKQGRLQTLSWGTKTRPFTNHPPKSGALALRVRRRQAHVAEEAEAPRRFWLRVVAFELSQGELC